MQSTPTCTLDLIDKYLYTPYVKGADGIEVELSAAILVKSETFSLRDMTAVKELIRELSGTNSRKDTEALAHLEATGAIEADTFHLCLKQIGT